MPVGAFVSGAANVVSSVAATQSNQRINQQNIAFQKQENAIARAREDNAHQREVSDLRAAGLSPLASTVGAGAASMTAPQAQQEYVPPDLSGSLQYYASMRELQQKALLNDAQIANLSASTTEKDINNSTLSAENQLKLAELEVEVDKLRHENKISEETANQIKDYLSAERNQMSSNAANSKAQSDLASQLYEFRKRDDEFYKFFGIPHDASVSVSPHALYGDAKMAAWDMYRLGKSISADNQARSSGSSKSQGSVKPADVSHMETSKFGDYDSYTTWLKLERKAALLRVKNNDYQGDNVPAQRAVDTNFIKDSLSELNKLKNRDNWSSRRSGSLYRSFLQKTGKAEYKE